MSRDNGRRSLLAIKRLMDIVGSALALIVCSPLFLVMALAIKASSKGPVLFRQQRVGQYGRRFTFLKFRSMHIDNDPSVHKEYVTKLIAGEAEREASSGNGKGVYKLTNDRRVTRVGKFLRRTSLDELPQFLNVLKGEMSLVGPRPAIPYEVAPIRRGTAAVCWKSSRGLPGCGRSMAEAASNSTKWSGWICDTPGPGLPGWTSKFSCARLAQ